jgi:hypothetical protein
MPKKTIFFHLPMLPCLKTCIMHGAATWGLDWTHGEADDADVSTPIYCEAFTASGTSSMVLSLSSVGDILQLTRS